MTIAFWSVRRSPARDVVPYVVAPFALGATVFASALVTGPLTGGSFNPARSLGPALAGGPWTAHWLYWLAPVIGMVVTMHLYDALRPANAPSTVPRGVPLGVEGPIGGAAAPAQAGD